MDPDESSSKRKRPGLEPTSLGRWLHPGDGGEWRGSKKARSVSGSRSPSPSGTSNSSEVGTSEPGRTNRNSWGLARLLPQSREHSGASNRRPSPRPPYDTSRNPEAVNATTSTRNLTGAARLGLEEAFRKLRIVTDTICPPLCSAIDDLTACLHVFEATTNNRQEYNDLTDELKCLVEQLIRYLHTSTSEDIADSISNISEAIRKEIESIGARQSSDGIRRMLDASDDDEDLRRRYRRIKQLFQQILGEASMSTWSITSEHYINTQLESLHPAKLARFDSTLATETNRRTCTESTRTRILQDSLAWTEDPKGAKVYWMNGMAGTGKTTIATTLCTALGARKQLAASFFCTRTSPECREAKRIVPTIAYQFARRSAPFRSALCKALKEEPDISTGSISSQFELLIKRPLMTAYDKLPDNLVIVIDALDECTDPHIVELFLNLVFRSLANMPIKLYLTSRPEPAIRNKMMSESERARSILYLHEIEKSLVQADIELYLKEELEFISPTDFDIKKLAGHAGNLFIYAATAVRYIHPTGKTVNSQARLLAILAANTESNQKLSSLDELYATILRTAIDDQDLEPEERTSIRLVLWTVICACEPILIKTLSVLCGLNNKSTTANALQPLRSVLHVSDHSELITTLHASFPDYMLAKERSGVFFCDKATHSQILAQRCFEIMKAQLRFNICSIKSSFIPDRGIPDLKDRIADNISEELFYASRFWVDHLSQASTIHILLSLTSEFLSKQLLFWIEVLNLKECLAAGVTIITKLNKWPLRANLSLYPSLLELASGASRFITAYILSPASAYTPHLYISLLPFSSSRHLGSRYLPRFKGLVKASGTLMEKLDLESWSSDIGIHCAALCPSSDLIALASENGEISVHNAFNGRYIVRPYKAQNSIIQCLDISSNSMWLVSGSFDCTLCVWSMQDGSLISGPYQGHSNLILSVKFSPDSVHFVSGSDDHNVGIWKSEDATAPLKSLIGHQKPVNSVDFSPDGTRIISGSDDNTIRVWGVSSGATVFIISCQDLSTMSVNCVRFTPDGAHIISVSTRGLSDHVIHSWNTSDGSLFGSVANIRHGSDSSIAISPERNHIAFVSSNDTVCICDRYTGELAASHTLYNDLDLTFRMRSLPITAPPHPSTIRFFAFSDDGMRMVSAYRDRTVRVWYPYGGAEQIKNRSRVTKSIYPHFTTISSNRARVAEIFIASINIWDLETASPIINIPLGTDFEPSGIKFLQLSPDGSRLFSVNDFGELCTWKTDTAELIDGHLCYTTRTRLDSAACSSNGTRVVTCSKGKIELWDTQLRRSITYLELEEYDRSYEPDVIFCQTGQRLVTNVRFASQKDFHVWDANNGVRLAGPFLETEFLDISPDGSVILSGTHSSQGLCLINVASGESSHLSDRSHSDEGLWTAMFSTDGLHVIAASSSVCKIWSIRDQTIIRIKSLWSGHLKFFAYSPGGWCQAYSTLRDEESVEFQVWKFRVDQLSCTTIDSDGWLREGENRPLLWVPQQIREDFPKGSSVRIKDGESLRVDYGDMFLGDEWSKCYIGD